MNRTKKTYLRKGVPHWIDEGLIDIELLAGARMDSLESAFVNAKELHRYLKKLESSLDNAPETTQENLYEKTAIHPIDWLDESNPEWLHMSIPCRWFVDYECMRQAIERMIELIRDQSVPYPNGIRIILLAVKEWLSDLQTRNRIGNIDRKKVPIPNRSKSNAGGIDNNSNGTGDFTEGNGESIPMAVNPPPDHNQ